MYIKLVGVYISDIHLQVLYTPTSFLQEVYMKFIHLLLSNLIGQNVQAMVQICVIFRTSSSVLCIEMYYTVSLSKLVHYRKFHSILHFLFLFVAAMEIPSVSPGGPDSPNCAICLTEPRNTVLICGHQLCWDCAQKVDHCPVCRKFVTHRIRLFQ